MRRDDKLPGDLAPDEDLSRRRAAARRSSSTTSTSRSRKGEFVCLIGHSGCGKSTVLSIAAGLLPPTRGRRAGRRQGDHRAGPDRGVVFQSPCLLPWMTAFENVMLGVEQVKPDAPRARARRRSSTRYLERGRPGRRACTRSRPSCRRACASASAWRARSRSIPKVLLLDEPFGMLDSLTRFELQEVLVETGRADRKTALMVTHDVDEALFLSDRIAMMTNGPAARLGGILEVPFPRPRDARRGAGAPRVLRAARAADRLPRGARGLEGGVGRARRATSTPRQTGGRLALPLTVPTFKRGWAGGSPPDDLGDVGAGDGRGGLHAGVVGRGQAAASEAPAGEATAGRLVRGRRVRRRGRQAGRPVVPHAGEARHRRLPPRNV